MPILNTYVIHGVGKPKIHYGTIATGETLPTSSISLPYCDSLVERFSSDFIQSKLTSGDLNTYKKGWYYSATLSYEKRMTKAVLESLEPLFDVSYTDFYLLPRLDNTNIFYIVDFPQDFSFQFMQKPFHGGHRGVVLEFVGTRRLTTIDLTSNVST